PLAVLRRCPLGRRVLVEHRLPDLVGRDERVFADAETRRVAAAPADCVAVDDRASLDQAATLAERLDDRLDHLVGREPLQTDVAGAESARIAAPGGAHTAEATR